MLFVQTKAVGYIHTYNVLHADCMVTPGPDCYNCYHSRLAQDNFAQLIWYACMFTTSFDNTTSIHSSALPLLLHMYIHDFYLHAYGILFKHPTLADTYLNKLHT